MRTPGSERGPEGNPETVTSPPALSRQMFMGHHGTGPGPNRWRQVPRLPDPGGGSGEGRLSRRASSASSFHSVQSIHTLQAAFLQSLPVKQFGLFLGPPGVHSGGGDEMRDQQHGDEGAVVAQFPRDRGYPVSPFGNGAEPSPDGKRHAKCEERQKQDHGETAVAELMIGFSSDADWLSGFTIVSPLRRGPARWVTGSES